MLQRQGTLWSELKLRTTTLTAALPLRQLSPQEIYSYRSQGANVRRKCKARKHPKTHIFYALLTTYPQSSLIGP